MPNHTGVSVRIELPGGPVRIPHAGGFTLKTDASVILPFGLSIGGAHMVSATVQPLARLDVDGVEHLFFFAREGIDPELVFASRGLSVELSDCSRESAGGLAVLRPNPGLGSSISIRGASGSAVIHILTEEQSLCFSILRLGGRLRAILLRGEVFEDEGALRLRVPCADPGQVELYAFPAVERPLTATGARMVASEVDGFSRCTLAYAGRRVPLTVTQPSAGDAEIAFPVGLTEGLVEVLLCVRYEGDVGNAFIDGALVSDDFANGQAWEIGLARLGADLERKGMYIHVTPRREGAVIIRESAMALQQELQGREVAAIHSIEALPIREIVVTAV